MPPKQLSCENTVKLSHFASRLRGCPWTRQQLQCGGFVCTPKSKKRRPAKKVKAANDLARPRYSYPGSGSAATVQAPVFIPRGAVDVEAPKARWLRCPESLALFWGSSRVVAGWLQRPLRCRKRMQASAALYPTALRKTVKSEGCAGAG